MKVAERIDAIEVRARAINLTLWRVCQLAGVNYGNLWRWKGRRHNPRSDLFEDAMQKLEGAIVTLERDMAARLDLAEARPAA